MKLKILLILYLITIAGNYSYSAVPDSSYADSRFVIDSILIKGNDITEEYIILRELTFAEGDTVTTTDLKYNEERVFSLNIFTKVGFNKENKDGKNILTISVEESWYIYPVPFAELKDKDWDKISYGVDLVVLNFRGRNEFLRVRAAFGYDKNYILSYSVPYLIEEENIFLRTDFSYLNSTNRSNAARILYGGDFEQKFVSSRITIGKRFGPFHKTALRLEYDYIETPFFIKGISASDDRIDRQPVLGLSYTYDTRDLVQFPKEGLYTYAEVVFKGLGVDDINYQVYYLDFREYRGLIDDLKAKWRLAVRHTAGETVPFYDYSFLGFGERIRGYFNYEQEGNTSLLSSVEIHYPVVKDFRLSLEFIPLIPKALLTYRFALYAQLFGDTGATWVSHEDISLNKFNTGYGFGLTLLILPYNTLRFETAFDEKFNQEWIFDLGISF